MESSMRLYTKRPEKKLWRRAAGPVLFAAAAVLTFYTIFHSSDADQIVPVLKQMDVHYVLAAAVTALFFVAAEGIMIWYLLHAVEKGVGLKQCVRYSFIGFFFSGITPSATGGQPVQLFFMNRDGIRTGNATAVLMGVATAYKLVLAVLGAGMLLFWGGPLAERMGSYRILFYIGLFLNLLLVVILLGLMCTDGIRRVLEASEKLLVRLHILKASAVREQKLEELTQSYRETVRFFGKRKGKIVFILLFTLLQRVSLFFLTWLIYRGLHLSGESIFLIMGLQAAVTIAVDMLPLPGGQGISEIVYYAVFMGVFPAGMLLPSMCAARGISFYFLLVISAVVAALSYLSGRRQNSATK